MEVFKCFNIDFHHRKGLHLLTKKIRVKEEYNMIFHKKLLTHQNT